jgi:ATP-dependent DNA ligase
MDLFESSFQKNAYLVSKDAKNKVRCLRIWYEWSDSAHAYLIHRQSWQHLGKRLDHPDITIKRGLVSRTVREQTQLQFNSNLKEYKDKGYKEIQNDPDSLTEEKLFEFLPEFNTDANGFPKHMLAKQASKVARKTIDSTEYYYASRKIDGLRCSFYWNGKEIKSASRGGGDYDFGTSHIRRHPLLIKFFQEHPSIKLDGELYKHGWSLAKINSAARMEKNAVDCDELQYYIYDIMVPNTSFKTRLKLLIGIAKYLKLSFNPEKEFKDEELHLQIVPQTKVTGYDNIMKLHDQYVAEGWEGVVCRDPDANYEFGSRKNAMIKFKMYKDDTFPVIDYELGLRGAEDMVFIMQLPDGRTFKAKPWGDRELKQYYVDNFETMYKGHIGECKFFYYSEDGIPLQPSFKAFREDL